MKSPLRGETFVTRKVTRAVGRIKEGLQNKLFLGNLKAKRDWGYAGDYVEAMWLMLQQNEPDDYVVATGDSHTVQELVELAFAEVGLDWQQYVETDTRYFRPTEVDALQGDASKARQRLGWRPRVGFKELVTHDGRNTTSISPSGRGSFVRLATMDPHVVRLRVALKAMTMPFSLSGKRVFVAGHRGMVGSALARRLARARLSHPHRGSP